MSTDPPTRTVLVCQNTACRKAGSTRVLAAFESDRVPEVGVDRVRCLGRCGNGPMVLVLPEAIWYCRVHPDEVPAIIERHLRGGIPVKAMLDRWFHPHPDH